ncbi:MAG: tetratricopeptide repeat protein, partial [Chromatiales bacterium]
MKTTRRHISKRRLRSVVVLGAVLLIAGCNLFTSTEDRFHDAVEHREKGKLNAAVIEFKNVLKAQPDHAQARWLLGKTYLDLNDGLSAKKELQRARELGVTDPQLLIALVRAHLQTGEPQVALQMIESTPGLAENADGLALRGEAQRILGRGEEAKQSYLAALEIEPQQRFARYGLIRLALSERNFEEAASRIDAALTADPED